MAYIGNPYQSQLIQPAADYFSGNGVTTSFTLNRTPVSVFAIEAVINNVQQNPSTAYTISGNTVTFTSAPPTGINNIYFLYNSVVGQQIGIGQGTVGPQQLTGGAPAWDANGNTSVAGNLTLTGTGAVTLPAGTTAQRPSPATVGMQRWNTTLAQHEVFIGNNVWQALASTSYTVNYLVVAGGGAGGRNGGGGGGAGGLLSATLIVNPTQSYPVVVGGGAASSGASGSSSILNTTITAIGGGGGGSIDVAPYTGVAGGSGGGGGNSTSGVYYDGGAGTAGQGFRGGRGLHVSSVSLGGGGGGGAGAIGQDQTGSGGAGGPGGAGIANPIVGSTTGQLSGSLYYVGGGGGGGMNSNTGSGSFGAGGLGGGGNGGKGTSNAVSGTANTGGGGGGADHPTYPGNVGLGGSGVVVISYTGAQRGFGGVITSVSGFTIHTFISSGTFVA